MNASWAEALAVELKRAGPSLLVLDLDADDECVYLRHLQVPRYVTDRGQADVIVGRVCAEADRRHLAVAVTPTGEYGTDLSRVHALYHRHGFAWVGDRETVSGTYTWLRPAMPPMDVK